MNDFVMHYGIPGQKRGVRRFQNLDGSLTPEGKIRYARYYNSDGTRNMKLLESDAKKDAEDYARAKAYFGEGAGTRRKLIKNRISERMKDPEYKKRFDQLFKSQNMEEHQKSAIRERKMTDAKNKAVSTAKGVKNFLLGFGTTSLAAVAIGIGIKKLVDANMHNSYKTPLNEVFNRPKSPGPGPLNGPFNYRTTWAAYNGSIRGEGYVR